MVQERAERRLATILAADVAGYSRLSEADEEATVQTLRNYRRIIDALVADHRGRVFGSAGDSVIVEFASPVEAVRCAFEIQQRLDRLNAKLPDDRRMRFRIGLNLGDVVVERNNLLGDGVNVAARLETLADPGGICLSGTVHEHVAGKLDLELRDIGEQTVKNIDRPIRAYLVGGALAPGPSAAGAAGVLARPAVAVLPFDNMSGDPEQAYFADGITEDIITELSRSRLFPVIARNSTFAYRGEARDVRRIARELDARYVLEGSVRKAGGRVRISAQLIDAASGRHMWAERYDRPLEDIFAVQDEITLRIAGAITPELSAAEQWRALRKPPRNLDAWDLFLRGQWHFAQYARADAAEARRCFEAAIALDPSLSGAHSGLAAVLIVSVALSWHEAPLKALQAIHQNAARALELDEGDAAARAAMAWSMFYMRRYDEARAEGEEAVALNPSYFPAHFSLGVIHNLCGRPEDAIASFDRASRLSPRDPMMFFVETGVGIAHYGLRRYGEAVDWLRKAIRHKPDFAFAHFDLAAGLGQLGRLDEARATLAEACRLQPEPTMGYFQLGWPYADPADFEHFMDGLRRAGLPG